MRKNIFWAVFIFLILAIDWLALDDITTNPEPDHLGEYATLAGSIIILGALAVLYLKKKSSAVRA